VRRFIAALERQSGDESPSSKMVGAEVMASNPGFRQQCPRCQVSLLLRDPSWIGKTVECPKCKQRFVVEDPAKKTVEMTREQKEELIRKDREAVRGGDGVAGKGNGAPVKQEAVTTKPRAAVAESVTAQPRNRLVTEPLLTGGALAEGSERRGVRRRKAKPIEGGVNLSIIITPMLDMAFQLLAFFVMTYHPSALEGHIDGNLLPPLKQAVKQKDNKPVQDNVAPSDTPPEEKDVITVQVKAVKRGQVEGKKGEGEPSRILIKRPEDTTGTLVADTDEDLEVGLKKLKDKLKSMQTAGGANKVSINIEADSDLKHQYFLKVYDACKAANFQNVGFAGPPDGVEIRKKE
jgi:biopolymer transport protein ExbD